MSGLDATQLAFNHPKMKQRRRKLRNDSTLPEKILWQKLRNNRLDFKFFRQYSIDNYVLDFYCPDKRLGVEIDGGHHHKADVKIYDSYRTRYLKAYNIRIIRFWNSDIVHTVKKVLADIQRELMSLS
jgi:very-short-patch-repair endonuclease